MPAPVVDLASVPFFAQTQFECGPAALATVLVASGVAVTPTELTPYLYLPGRRGSLQAEVIAATRRYDRVPYVLSADLRGLLLEVAAGTPVLVLQNLATARFPRWHYAVVVGYDAQRDRLLLRSATTERVWMSRQRFVASWQHSGQWAMVAAPLAAPPITATPVDWIGSVSAFESLGRPGVALTGYRAATERWRESALAWQAQANAQHALHDYPSASTALRQAIALRPTAAAYNNLAHVLLSMGQSMAAERALEQAVTLPDAPAIESTLAQTRERLARHEQPAVARVPTAQSIPVQSIPAIPARQSTEPEPDPEPLHQLEF